MTFEECMSALFYLLRNLKKVMFINGYVENWIIMIELNEKGLFDLNYSV